MPRWGCAAGACELNLQQGLLTRQAPVGLAGAARQHPDLAERRGVAPGSFAHDDGFAAPASLRVSTSAGEALPAEPELAQEISELWQYLDRRLKRAEGGYKAPDEPSAAATAANNRVFGRRAAQ